ncbi:MAG: hypothetical protein IMY72_11070 [Bacteroidetes bacterium]|nr:hypothetical protein [Bacteroidota bacterium]
MKNVKHQAGMPDVLGNYFFLESEIITNIFFLFSIIIEIKIPKINPAIP